MTVAELPHYKDYNWYHTTKTHRGITHLRFLYDLLKYKLYNRWKIIPKSPSTQPHDCNPYKYRLANGYEERMDYTPTTPVSDDIADLLDMLEDRDNLPTVEALFTEFRGLYSHDDLIQACKLLNKELTP